METESTTQIRIDVPAERVPEFYAFFARFLAVGGPGRGRRGRQAGGPGHRGHHCGHHRGDHAAEWQTEAPAETTTA